MTQSELNLDEQDAAATMFNWDVEELVHIVKRRRDWLTSDAIIREQAKRNASDRRFTKTYLRHLSKAAKGRVMSGQRGYKYTGYATHDEIIMAGEALLKTANGCLDRRRDIFIVYHKGDPPAEAGSEDVDQSKKERGTDEADLSTAGT